MATRDTTMMRDMIDTSLKPMEKRNLLALTAPDTRCSDIVDTHSILFSIAPYAYFFNPFPADCRSKFLDLPVVRLYYVAWWIMKNLILNTEDIKAGNLLRFRTDAYGYGLFSLEENLKRFMLVKAEMESSPVFEQGDSLDIYLSSEKKGSYSWQSRVLGKIKDPQGELIALAHCPDAKWSTERICIRTHAHIPFVFFAFNPSDESRMFESSAPDFQKATVLEMTDREAILETGKKIDGSIFRGHLQLGNRSIDVAGKATEESHDRYRLQILSLENRDRKVLLEYIYKNCGK